MRTNKAEIMHEHYKMLREEILLILEEIRKTEVLVIGAIGAFYAWLSAHPPVKYSPVWVAPIVFAIVGSLRTWMLFSKMGELSHYLRKIEERWSELDKRQSDQPPRPDNATAKVGGRTSNEGWPDYWETYFKRNHRFKINHVTVALWVLVVGGTIAAPFVLEKSDGSVEKAPLKVQLIDGNPTETPAPKN